MIVEEPNITGTLYRLHPDPEGHEYTAQWLVTADGEIKGFMCSKPTASAFREFGAWCREYPGSLKISTKVESIQRIIKKFGFTEYRRTTP